MQFLVYGDTGGVEPLRPSLARIHMQRRKFWDAPWVTHLLSPAEPRAANDKQFFGAQTGNMEPVPSTVAMPDADIDIFTRKVDTRHRGGNAQIDFGVSFGEDAQTWHQPLGGKSGDVDTVKTPEC